MGGGTLGQPSRRDLGEEAREVGAQGEQAPVAAHERVGPRLEGAVREHVRVVEEGRDDLLVVPAFEDREHALLDAPPPARLFAHEALDAGGNLGQPMRRRSSSHPHVAGRERRAPGPRRSRPSPGPGRRRRPRAPRRRRRSAAASRSRPPGPSPGGGRRARAGRGTRRRGREAAPRRGRRAPRSPERPRRRCS